MLETSLMFHDCNHMIKRLGISVYGKTAFRKRQTNISKMNRNFISKNKSYMLS